MSHANKLALDKSTDCDGILTFEPDCLPLRHDWIEVLSNEWMKTKIDGKMAFGTVLPVDTTGQMHMNGNMVLDIRATKRFPQLQLSNRGWDTTHARLFLEHGRHSQTIIQRTQKNREVPVQELLLIMSQKEPPALVHGIKHDEPYNVIIELIKDGSFGSVNV